jgi:hypothetical protein
MEDSLELVINDQTEQVAEVRRRRNDSDSDWDIARTVMSAITLFGDSMIDAFLPSVSRRLLFFIGVSTIISSGLTTRWSQRRPLLAFDAWRFTGHLHCCPRPARRRGSAWIR